MDSFIPQFNWYEVIITPWTVNFETSVWIVLMGFFVTAACGLVGVYILLRRMALVGDAISHSILPGLIVAFLIFKNSSIYFMYLGAAGAGLVTVLLIEFIHKQSRVKPDAAMCIVFTIFFAAGVAMISSLEARGGMHIDADCVLYGEIAFVSLEPIALLGGIPLGPPSILRMGIVLLGVIALISVFYKELLVTSFDQGLARSMGIRLSIWHYGLMAVLSIVIVSAFESVGAILAIAMLIVPPMFAAQLAQRLISRMLLVCLHAFLSAISGYHISVWLQCSTAGAMVTAASGLFVISWIYTTISTAVIRSRLKHSHQVALQVGSKDKT